MAASSRWRATTSTCNTFDITYVHGEPTVLWDEEEVDNMLIQEDLEFAVIEKFSYEWLELEEIRKIVPLQYEIKAECKMDFLRDRHVLIRLTTMEDCVHIMLKPAYFLRAKDGFYQMRSLKWEPWFNPEVETTMTLA
ncbi:hypothetical protein KY289_027187 [Solanum tuberosum]|nr:hypothetical protein KY289_027187 [Solanum tuberosum]